MMKKEKRFQKLRMSALAVLLVGCFAFPGLSVYGSEETKSAEAAFIELEDGEYAIPVELSGGSGKSTVNSPAGLL